MAFGILILLYALMIYLLGDRTVPGFTFLASIIAIFSGVQLFSLGIIGEYIGAIYTQVQDRPLIIARERINF